MARVARPETAFQKQPTGKQSRRVRDDDYLAWIRSLPCVITGIEGASEAAHISFPDPRYGKLGRGKGTKESDVWCLPLSNAEHRASHAMNEKQYWAYQNIDPCVVAMSLYVAYPNTEIALIILREIWNRPRKMLWARGLADGD